jgi:hypothetical protein
MNKLLIISILLLSLSFYGCVKKVILTESNMVPCTPFSNEVISIMSDSHMYTKYGTVIVYTFISNKGKKDPLYDVKVVAKMDNVVKSSKTDFNGTSELKLPVGTYEFLIQGIGYCDKVVKNVNVHPGGIVSIEINAEQPLLTK